MPFFYQLGKSVTLQGRNQDLLTLTPTRGSDPTYFLYFLKKHHRNLNPWRRLPWINSSILDYLFFVENKIKFLGKKFKKYKFQMCETGVVSFFLLSFFFFFFFFW